MQTVEPFTLFVAAAMTLAVSYCASLFASETRYFLDEPNERSSHVSATPRIGGLAIMSAWFVGMFIVGVFAFDLELARTAALVAFCGGLALGLGLADDWTALSAAWKFAGQVVIAAFFVGVFGPIEVLPIPYIGDLTLSPLWGVLLSTFWIVAFMNAFNFMDGSNGLAAGAAAAGLAWVGVIAALTGAMFVFAAAMLLAIACVGFLPQDLVRGKLFMGDGGSLSLGLLIAVLALLGAKHTDGRMSVLVVPVIFAPLLFDVAWTLVSRLIRKQNVLQAHREHMYQLLIRSGASHPAVAVVFMALVNVAAATAIWMLTLPYSLQWLAPGMLAAFFAVGGSLIYRRANADGHFSKAIETDDKHAKQDDEALPPLRAAE